jgi:tetratricopeptide (TPR) repeat protein
MPKLVAGLALWFAAHATAQERLVNSFEGEIVWEGGTPEDLNVELVQGNMMQDKAMVNPDGRFHFRAIREGQYELRVLTRTGDVLRRDFLVIHEPSNAHVIQLPPNLVTRSASGTVSAKALARVIPKDARKAFARAAKAAEKREFRTAIAQLRRAVEICPDYLEAWNNLGVRYMHADQYEAAFQAFDTALRIDPDAALAHANVAVALVTLRRFAEAEAAARRALQLDPSLLHASYALGLSWAGRGECRSDAIRHLQEAAQRFPHAHLAAAQMLACQGNSDAATDEVRAYLRVASPAQRPPAEAFLQRLTSPR